MRASGPKWAAPDPQLDAELFAQSDLRLEALHLGGYPFRYANVSPLEIDFRREVFRNVGCRPNRAGSLNFRCRFPLMDRAVVGTASIILT